MNISLFIARKLYSENRTDTRVSKLATQIATIGIIIGLAVMIVSISVLFGFKHELRSKIMGFGSHIQILHSNASTSPESFPIVTDESFCKQVASKDDVAHVQRFANKMGIFKTDDDFKGIMLKGIGKEYDTSFLKSHLLEGEIPHFTPDAHQMDIVISKLTANQMNLKVGDKIFAYFFEKSIRTRRFRIVGIYQTNMNQFDENVVIANLNTVIQLNGWEKDQSSGLEIFAKSPSRINQAYNEILPITRDAIDHYGNTYSSFTVNELYSQIFDWLKLLDLNVWVILGLMVCVACFTMISGLLILILERTNTIGVLKALGSSNVLIRRIFIYYSSFMMLRGIVLGNVIGLGLCLIQQLFHPITLDPSKYYVSAVPILINPSVIILLNIATILVCLLTMIGPSYLVSRIRPVKAIRFD